MKCACGRSIRRRQCLNDRCAKCHRAVCPGCARPGSLQYAVRRASEAVLAAVDDTPDDPNVRYLYRGGDGGFRVPSIDGWIICDRGWDDAIPLGRARAGFGWAVSLGYTPIEIMRSEGHPDFVDPVDIAVPDE